MMNNLSTYIIEKLKINKNININNKFPFILEFKNNCSLDYIKKTIFPQTGIDISDLKIEEIKRNNDISYIKATIENENDLYSIITGILLTDLRQFFDIKNLNDHQIELLKNDIINFNNFEPYFKEFILDNEEFINFYNKAMTNVRLPF